MGLAVRKKSSKLPVVNVRNQEIEVWRASEAEADRAFRLVEEYFKAADVVSREDRSEFREEYFGEGRGLWLARTEGESAGCVGLRELRWPGDGQGGRCAEIKRMYVRNEFRGRGIAERLLKSAERFARDSGYAWIFLDTTDEMAAAARLYERNGYERCERYNDNPQATIFMRKKLTSAF